MNEAEALSKSSDADCIFIPPNVELLSDALAYPNVWQFGNCKCRLTCVRGEGKLKLISDGLGAWDKYHKVICLPH